MSKKDKKVNLLFFFLLIHLIDNYVYEVLIATMYWVIMVHNTEEINNNIIRHRREALGVLCHNVPALPMKQYSNILKQT